MSGPSCRTRTPARAGADGDGSRQADLRGQPGEPGPVPSPRGYAFVAGRHLRRRSRSTTLVPGHDAVVNFAAESHVDRSIAGAAPFVTTNVLGTQVLLDAARAAGVGRFVHVSTDEVYGSIDEGSWTEDWPLAAELAVLRVEGRLRPDGARLRTGPTGWTSWSPAARTTTGRTSSRRRSSRCSSPTCSTASRCRCTATAATSATGCTSTTTAAGIQLALEKGRPGEIYNIGGGTELTNKELTERLLAACGAGWDMVRAGRADRKGHDRRYSLDITKIGDELGYAPAGRLRGRPGRDGRLVPRQPRLVGAAQGAGRAADALAGHRRGRHARPGPARGARRGGRCGVAPRPGPSWTSPTPRRSRDAVAGRRRRAQRGRRGPRSTAPRPTRTPRPRSTAHAVARSRRGLRRPARGWSTCPPTTSSPATPPSPYAEDAPTGADQRVRAQQARRRAGRAWRCRTRLRRADRLALRRARPQLRRDHAAAGRRAGDRRRGRRPATGRPPGRTRWPGSSSRWPVRRPGAPAPGVYHGTAAGADHLVRPGAGGLRGGRARPGAGPADDQRPVPAAGAAADLQRARARALGRHRDPAAAGLADHAQRGDARRSLIAMAAQLPSGVLFGAAYYAEYQPYDRLSQDLDLMARAGFTVIRVGESVWSTWEPRDGEFDLDWLQPVLDAAHERGITAIVGTPTYAVPPWLRAPLPGDRGAAAHRAADPVRRPPGHRLRPPHVPAPGRAADPRRWCRGTPTTPRSSAGRWTTNRATSSSTTTTSSTASVSICATGTATSRS